MHMSAANSNIELNVQNWCVVENITRTQSPGIVENTTHHIHICPYTRQANMYDRKTQRCQF